MIQHLVPKTSNRANGFPPSSSNPPPPRDPSPQSGLLAQKTTGLGTGTGTGTGTGSGFLGQSGFSTGSGLGSGHRRRHGRDCLVLHVRHNDAHSGQSVIA